MSLFYPMTWTRKAIATLTQTPVQNTWYTVLDTTKNCRLASVSYKQVNDETAAKNCNIRITVDGVTLTSAADDASQNNTVHYVNTNTGADTLNIAETAVQPGVNGEPLEGRSVKVEVRTTSAVGTTPVLSGYIQYDVLQ